MVLVEGDIDGESGLLSSHQQLRQRELALEAGSVLVQFVIARLQNFDLMRGLSRDTPHTHTRTHESHSG
jgi:hypothetical protein